MGGRSASGYNAAMMWLFLPLLQLILTVVIFVLSRTGERRKRLFAIVSLAGSALVCLAMINQGYQSSQQNQRNERLLRNLNGADSFPVVSPQPRGNGDEIGLAVWNFGDALLSGVSLEITCGGVGPVLARETFAVIPSHQVEQMQAILNPEACHEASNHFTIEGASVAPFVVTMTAQSGKFIENLQFKRAHRCSRWGSRMWIITPGGVGFSKNHQLGVREIQARIYGDDSWREPCP
jgi:hypothetical protein